MVNTKLRRFCVKQDVVEVLFHHDHQTGRYFGQYPDFESTPRFTPCGRPWVNATNTGCPYAEEEFDDCGSCRHLLRERSGDLIGVCMHEKKQRVSV